MQISWRAASAAQIMVQGVFARNILLLQAIRSRPIGMIAERFVTGDVTLDNGNFSKSNIFFPPLPKKVGPCWMTVVTRVCC